MNGEESWGRPERFTGDEKLKNTARILEEVAYLHIINNNNKIKITEGEEFSPIARKLVALQIQELSSITAVAYITGSQKIMFDDGRDTMRIRTLDSEKGGIVSALWWSKETLWFLPLKLQVRQL